MALPSVKPKCGTTGPPQVYDLPIHVIGLFLVLTFSCLGAGFPLAAKRFKGLRIPPRVFFFCKHFGTGVLIATAFVHLLPTAFESLNNPCLPDLFTEKYPAMPGVIGLASMFMLFGVEMWMHSKMPHSHSHGGATGEEFSGNFQHPLPLPPVSKGNPQPGRAMSVHEGMPVWIDEKKTAEESFLEMGFPEIEAGSEMPMWFIAFYEQYVRQRNEMLGMMTRYAPSVPPYRAQESIHEKPRVVMTESSEAEEFGVVDLEHGAVDPMVLRKMSMEITLLEGGILFHSVFVGMTVSLTTEGFIVLLIAILFHQTFEGLGLGSRIAAVPYPKGSWKPWALIFAFGTTAPIGQAIGLITRNTYDPNSAFALILVGFFNAFSSGLLIYAGLVDLLHADFLSEEADRVLTNKKKMLAFSFVLMGAATGFNALGIFGDFSQSLLCVSSPSQCSSSAKMISISDPVTIGITFTFLALATVALLIRCHLRYRIEKNHGPEDILLVCAWLLAIPEQILLCISVRRYEGVDPQQVTYVKMFFWTLIIHNLILTCSKLSILVQYLQIFPHGKTAKACWYGTALVVCNASMQVILTVFHCAPVSAFWNEKGTCLSHTVLFWPSGIGNVITSLAIFIIPISKIRSLEMDRRAKIIVVFSSGVGSLLVPNSLVALSHTGGLTRTPRDILISVIRFLRMGFSAANPTSRGGIWTPLESTVAIICASAVALGPFFAGTIPRFSTAMRHGRTRAGSNDEKLGRDAAVEDSYVDEKELPRLPTSNEEKEIGLRLSDRIPVEDNAVVGLEGEVRTSLLGIGIEDKGISRDLRENADKEIRTRPRASTLMRIGVVLPKGGKVTDSTFLTTTPADIKKMEKRSRASTLMRVGVSLPNGGKVTDSTFLTSTPIDTNAPKRRERASTLMRIGVVLPRGGKVMDSTFLITPSATQKEVGNRTRSSTLVNVGLVLDDGIVIR
ncbi:hypothetical protein BLS_004202 [Venturia inaequalis]|uniref:Rhodopsin domain-containing protein n=1 Tax=Venturia inaequalis TaxID=5025 RepID=A0A8H3UJT1_VENIN|nr:hypothetical protein BLS_004202 [Venturia inaequalis]